MAAGLDDRKYWLSVLERLARPVLEALAARELKTRMPLGSDHPGVKETVHLAALARLLAGIAPWLESGSAEGDEGELRGRLIGLTRQALDAAADPYSPDLVNFLRGPQAIVDGGFLAQALLRAPVELWSKLPVKTRRNLSQGLIATRDRFPAYDAALLSAAMIETFLRRMTEFWDPMRVDCALRQFEAWHLGDGIYGNGPAFKLGYDNGSTIHPLLVDIHEALGADHTCGHLHESTLSRAKKFAAIQERMIAPDGSFPPIGDALAIRTGAFNALALAALRRALPEGISPAQVRGALTAVLRRCMEAPGAFDANGWLTVGRDANPEFSTGHGYLAATVLLPLGLPADDPFWSSQPEAFTAQKVWAVRPGGTE